MSMNVTVELANASSASGTPDADSFGRWARCVMSQVDGGQNWPAHVTEIVIGVRVIEEEESRLLNSTYRSRNKPTNVLSFPSQLPAVVLDTLDEYPLGDLAICATVVAQEAQDQDKALEAHWAHMSVHGLLHLLGFDHEQEAEAELMENTEREILSLLGYPDPYQEEVQTT